MLELNTSALTAAIPDAALIIGEDDSVLAANDQAARLFGKPLEGRALSDIAPEGIEAEFLTGIGGSPFQAEASLSRLDAAHRLMVARDVTVERQQASQLADAERIAAVGIWEWHVPTNVVTWSPEAYRLFGHSPETTTPSYEIWLESIHPDDREWVNDFVQKAFAERTDYDFEHRVLAADGTVRHLHCRGQVIVDEENEPLRLVGASQDITERVAQQEEIDRVAGQREAMLDAAGEGVCGLDLEGRVTFINPHATQLLGVEADQMIGGSILDRLGPDIASRLRVAIAAGTAMDSDEGTLLREGAPPTPIAVHCAPLLEDETPVGAVLTFTDASERKRFEEQLSYLADHDGLTGLLNRNRFEEQMAAQMRYADQYGGSLAVLMLDLDHFKDVNDTGGHGGGDDLLRTIGGVLRDELGGAGTLARLGGDEFAVLLAAADEAAAMGIAERLRAAVAAKQLLIGGRRVHVTASIGVAVGPGAGSDAESILADADVAMYQAKEAGRNAAAIYRPELGGRERMQQRLDWTGQIRTALADDGFTLYAQPIVELGGAAGTAAAHCEILIRMPQAGGELALPASFLPVAERHGLIRDVDRWVVAQSIKLAAAERHAGRATVIDINLSGRTMGDSKLSEFVATELDSSGADPQQLVFEVTETAAIDNLAEARALAESLVELGCGFAIDDFGAGFGSFAYLKHLPAQLVKIDGDFIRRLPTSPNDQLVVRAIVGLAHGMGKRVVAEMVEDEATVDLLRELEVDLGQGFHLGRPAPVADVLGSPVGAPPRA